MHCRRCAKVCLSPEGIPHVNDSQKNRETKKKTYADSSQIAEKRDLLNIVWGDVPREGRRSSK